MASINVEDQIRQWIIKERDAIASLQQDIHCRRDLHNSFVQKVMVSMK
jgi:hypothetical protein